MEEVWTNELSGEQAHREGGTCSEPEGHGWGERRKWAFLTSPTAPVNLSPMNSPRHILNLLKGYEYFCGHL